jgi:hypothetical protein
MKLVLATVFSLLFAVTAAQAGGPFDGTWKGGASQAGRNCAASSVTSTVTDNQVSGVSHSEGRYTTDDTFTGTVMPDGSFSGLFNDGTVFTGKFEAMRFHGTYFSTCVKGNREITLDRAQ